jgi:hypothetical protein
MTRDTLAIIGQVAAAAAAEAVKAALADLTEPNASWPLSGEVYSRATAATTGRSTPMPAISASSAGRRARKRATRTCRLR